MTNADLITALSTRLDEQPGDVVARSMLADIWEEQGARHLAALQRWLLGHNYRPVQLSSTDADGICSWRYWRWSCADDGDEGGGHHLPKAIFLRLAPAEPEGRGQWIRVYPSRASAEAALFAALASLGAIDVR